MSETIKYDKHEAPSLANELNVEVNQKNEESEKNIKEAGVSQKENLETARKTIEKQPSSAESTKQLFETNEQTQHHHYITKQIKSESYKQTIKQVQKVLTPTESKFSKFIHQPKIETISDIGAKTIARPSSIISGSLLALTAGVGIIIIAKHIGFYVTPLVFTVLFIAGYIMGLLLEIIIKIVIKPFKKHPEHT